MQLSQKMHKDLIAQWRKNPQYVKAYEALEAEYAGLEKALNNGKTKDRMQANAGKQKGKTESLRSCAR